MIQKHAPPASAKQIAEPPRRKSGGKKNAYFDLVNQAPAGYFTLDAAGQILDANLTLAALLGVPPGELVQHAFSAFVFPEDQALYERFRRTLSESGAPQACELRIGK